MIKSSLSKQLFRRIFGLYLAAAVVVTAVQLSLEYRHTQDEVSTEMKQVLSTFTPGIIDALWNYDKTLIGSILIGMHELSVIDGIQVFDHRGLLVKSKGVELTPDGTVKLVFDKHDLEENRDQFTSLNKLKVRLTHYSKKNARKDRIGEIIIYSSNRIVIDRVKYGFMLIIINSIIKTMALWFIFFYFIDRLLSKPLKDFSHQLTDINLDNLANKKLVINAKDNELHSLQNHFNEMIEKIKHSSDELQKSHHKIALINVELAQEKEQLEERVKQRTQELKHSMQQLADSSKMASLSKLLTSMAHEFNTPLGIAITSSSYQQELLENLKKEFENGNITKDELENYINGCSESSKLSSGSLKSISELINRFKQLDTQQKKADLKEFSVLNSLNICLHSFNNEISGKNIQITTEISEDLVINSDSELFSNILFTLIDNSITHGFKQRSHGHIKISAHINNDLFILKYQDDGNGIDSQFIDNIFDPFTNNMAEGGTGLGLNIMYNLINFQLDGDVTCHDNLEQGVSFTIRWPVNDSSEDE